MLQFVHHVHYLVRDRDAMVKYMEKHFGLKPSLLEVNHNGIEARYKIGPTEIQFTQPTDPNSSMGKQIAKSGPSVFHVAFGVNNIRDVAKDLAAKGHKMRARGKDGKELVSENQEGILICNLDPASSEGIWFQLAEG